MLIIASREPLCVLDMTLFILTKISSLNNANGEKNRVAVSLVDNFDS